MRLLLRYILTLSVILAWSGIAISAHYGVTFPREPGPRFDPRVRQVYRDAIDSQLPDLVLLGDSTLESGVDARLLESLAHRQILNIAIRGSASALWYLIFKNNIVDAADPPQTLILFFRGTMLTAPGFRVQGTYLDMIDEYAGRNEPSLLRRSFLDQMNPIEIAAEKYLPLYGIRVDIRRDVDGFNRYRIPEMAGCNVSCTDEAMNSTLDGSELEPGELRKAVAAAEQYLYTPRQLDFHRQVERSFLPEMIRLAKENDIQVIFVRLKINPAEGDESHALQDYIRDLRGYLSQNDIPFLDFQSDTRLIEQLFRDVTHLNEAGRRIFTRLLAEALEPVLK